MNRQICKLAIRTGVAAAVGLQSGAGNAQTPDGAYRGRIVCEKIEIARDIVNVPFALIVRGQTVQFARPVFNLRGGLFGSELGSGTVGSDGKMDLKATRVFLGQTVESEYSGTVTATGGTLSGKQSWHGSNGAGSRNCHVALVPAPRAMQATAKQQ